VGAGAGSCSDGPQAAKPSMTIINVSKTVVIL
jgi:hypothetical protein